MIYPVDSVIQPLNNWGQIVYFLQISFISVKVMIQNEISNLEKKSLKKINYWQRNGGFKFWPEVKITRLIDIFSAVFSNQFFSLEADTVKS